MKRFVSLVLAILFVAVALTAGSSGKSYGQSAGLGQLGTEPNGAQSAKPEIASCWN